MVEVFGESPPSEAFDHAAWAEVYNAAEPQAAHHVSAALIRRGDAVRSRGLYARRTLARVGGEVVGCGLAMHLSYAHDPHRLWVWVSVVPWRQREGIGGALFADLLAGAREAVRPRQLVCRVGEDNAAGRRFLDARGFVVRQRAVPSALDLATWVDGGEAVEARARAAGVEVMSLARWRARGEGWEEGLWALNAELEARLPSPLPMTPIGAEEFRRVVLESPTLCWDATQVAVARDGACVGSSFLYRSLEDAGLRKVGLTGVRSDYVRRGVATALKQAVARCAKAQGARTLWTENADTNPMLGLNVALGFVPQPGVWVMVCDLPGGEAA